MKVIDSDLLSVQEARILAENAYEAQQKLAVFPQSLLDQIVEGMVRAIRPHMKELAYMSCDETEYGIWSDKLIKNKFVCTQMYESLKDMQCVGIINRDDEKQIMDVGVPVGVIIGLCPATSPVSTTIYKALIAVKSGNAILFAPHPRACKTMMKTLDILIEAAVSQGLPIGAMEYLHTVTPEGTKELINHSAASLILNTGVEEMLEAAYQSGKPVIYGGNGNGPAFIEKTADVKKAVSDIMESKTFDCGVVSAAEQSIVVDSCVEQEVRWQLTTQGAYFMSEEEAESLSCLLYHSDGTLNSQAIGKPAAELAKRAGFRVPDSTRVLIAKQKYVSFDNPYSKEKLCPVLSYYVEPDWMHACDKCIELLLSERRGHTLAIHSKNPEVIRQFALKKPVGRILVNTSVTFGSMGITTNLVPAMTLGSGSAGKGITADNVSPMNLIYIRKIGYEVRTAEEFKAWAALDELSRRA